MRPRLLVSLLIASALVVPSFSSTLIAATARARRSAADDPATWTVRPGPGQLTVLGAAPGIGVELLDSDAALVATGDVDLLGSLLFRGLEPGGTRSARKPGQPAQRSCLASTTRRRRISTPPRTSARGSATSPCATAPH